MNMRYFSSVGVITHRNVQETVISGINPRLRKLTALMKGQGEEKHGKWSVCISSVASSAPRQEKNKQVYRGTHPYTPGKQKKV